MYSPKKYGYYTNRYKYLRCGWVRLLPVGHRGDAGLGFNDITKIVRMKVLRRRVILHSEHDLPFAGYQVPIMIFQAPFK